MNLLIVDDDLIILEAMKNFLEKEGLEVTTTADADEGLKILQVRSSFYIRCRRFCEKTD